MWPFCSTIATRQRLHVTRVHRLERSLFGLDASLCIEPNSQLSAIFNVDDALTCCGGNDSLMETKEHKGSFPQTLETARERLFPHYAPRHYDQTKVAPGTVRSPDTMHCSANL